MKTIILTLSVVVILLTSCNTNNQTKNEWSALKNVTNEIPKYNGNYEHDKKCFDLRGVLLKNDSGGFIYNLNWEHGTDTIPWTFHIKTVKNNITITDTMFVRFCNINDVKKYKDKISYGSAGDLNYTICKVSEIDKIAFDIEKKKRDSIKQYNAEHKKY